MGPNLSIDSTKTDSDEPLISAIEDANKRLKDESMVQDWVNYKSEEGGSGSPMLYGNRRKVTYDRRGGLY